MKNVTSTGSFLFYCVQNLFININQFDELNFIISLFQASTCFEHMCSSSGGQILYYTVSGIITPIGGCPVHRLREDSIMSLFQASTCFEHMCSSSGRQKLYYKI